MAEVTPLPAEPADAGAVREMVRSAYAPYVAAVGGEPAPMNTDYERAIEAGDVHVVREDGEIASVVVTRGEGDHLLIENIAVAPARQSRGLGRAMLVWAEARAASRGYDEVRLYTHETMVENIAFYRRHGFEITRVAADDPYGRVHLRKVRSSP